MWQAGTYSIILVSLIAVLMVTRRLRGDWRTLAVILMIWVRFAMAALGETAVDTSVAGFSLIALSTLMMTAFGILIIPLDFFRARPALPFYALVSLGILSGGLNGSGMDVVTFVIIWAYFLACVLLLYRAYVIHGHTPILQCLMAAFSLPLGMQLLSVAVDNPKVGLDGSFSYIGGYVHEAVYAVVLLAALWLAVFYPWRRQSLKWVVVFGVIAGLFLANYRTMIIAAAPILLAFLLHYSNTDRRLLLRLSVLVLLGALVLPPLFATLPGERFQEINTGLAEFGNISKPPEEFTARDKDTLSARLYIWSSYLHGTLNADVPQLLIGHGPEARAPGLTVHAHNEYFRILFESGIVGFTIWIFILAQQLMIAIRRLPEHSALMVLAGYLAIMLGALGTSFFNRPEGMILFAILCSTNWYYANARAQSRSANSDLPLGSRGSLG